jgi:cellulose synthase/poly-beta-1,6-N-acetylglucosamine synthase-like glycosyltransferase
MVGHALFDGPAAIVVLLGLAIIWLTCWRPLSRSFDSSDRGSGSQVVLPAARPARLWRAALFTAMCALTSLGIIGLRNPSLAAGYRHLIALSADMVVRDPAIVDSYVRTLLPIIPLAVISFLVALSIALPASVGRRLVILAHGVIFLCAAIASDTVILVFSIVTGIPVGPYPIVSIFMHMLIAYVIVIRLAFTTFQLPNRTPVRVTRQRNWADDALLVLAAAVAMPLVSAAAIYVLWWSGYDPTVRLFLIFATPGYIWLVMFTVLVIMRRLAGPLPSITDERPAVDVIIPAFNEEAIIAALLQSIDEAAEVYGGPVRVVMCDDGSTDATGPTARATMAQFRAATGQVIAGVHHSKSRALNQALASCTADIVVRIDADCTMDRNAILYAVPWFLRDPLVGSVGAFSRPLGPYTSWIQRMRAFELCYSYGFTRLAMATVDGVPCIPGTFTAFRREPALHVGGFVEGMNGEDMDLTYNLGRFGLRAAIDRRIISNEDTPISVAQLREQRIRWNRGGTQTFARFTPWGVGTAGPRTWFSSFRAAGKRLSAPIHLAVLVYAVELAILDPTYHRNLLLVAEIIVLAQVPLLVVKAGAAVYYLQGRRLPWLALWPVFSILKRLFALEAVLTFPTRPVALRLRPAAVAGHERAPALVLEPSLVASRVAMPEHPAAEAR